MLNSELLQQFIPFNQLEPVILNELVNQGQVESLANGESLFELGSTDTSQVYLLEGELQLTAEDGRVQCVKPGQPNAQKPVASLLPRKYSVKAVKTSSILRFDDDILTKASNGHLQAGISVEEEAEERNGLEGKIFEQILVDMSTEVFSLPSLPDVAMQVMSMMKKDDADANKLETYISADPAIAAKLLKVANSALYGGEATINSIGRAIVRIGLETTAQLVSGFALEKVFKSDSKDLQQQMRKVWLHSNYVACISAVLAEKLRLFDSGKAMLAGLVHDIGVVAVLSYLQQHKETKLTDKEVDFVCHSLRAEVGMMILSKWNFPEIFSVVAEAAEDWHRNQEEKADLADLVMIAQAHAYIKEPSDEKIPAMYTLPAFKKLGLQEWSAEEGIEVLREADTEIKNMLSIFSSS